VSGNTLKSVISSFFHIVLICSKKIKWYSMLRSLLFVAVAILIMDTVWLTLQYDFNINIIKTVQKTAVKIRYIPAALVYVLLPLAVTYFAILPSNSLKESMLKGAFLGLSIYGVYDLTNLATFDNWTNRMAIQDMAWGTFLFGVLSGVGYKFK
jgi:uncharacterized membrane protein